MNTYEIALLLAQNVDHIDKIENKLLSIISVVINKIALPIGAGLIIIAIILAGLRYIQGDPKGGKASLIAAITGLVIVILSYIIIYQIVAPAIMGSSSASSPSISPSPSSPAPTTAPGPVYDT